MNCTHDLAERETACADGMCPICTAAENERLRAELAAAQKDAERYRWLEERPTATGLSRWMGRHQFLSTAIDAARKESE